MVPPPAGGQPQVKAEPVDSRYMLASNYYAPSLPGPNLNRTLPPPVPTAPHPGGQTGVISFARSGQTQPPAPTARPYAPSAPAPAQSPVNSQSSPPVNGHAVPAAGSQPASAAQQRIPQVDGPSESSGDEGSPEPTGYAPRTSHPSLPQPGSVQPLQQQPTVAKDEEAINSDLDDSDTENEAEAEEGGAGDTDIVFCTYDKVIIFFSILFLVGDAY